MAESYIQLNNTEGDPFFVELKSGKVLWTLPVSTDLKAVKYLSHLNEEGQPYFEDLSSGEVSQFLF